MNENILQEPIDKLVSDVKKALDEYNNRVQNNISIKIVKDSKEFELVV